MRFLPFAAWLFVSAFVVPHAGFYRLATWVVAALVTAAALASADKPNARFAVAALAVALAAIALLVPGASSAAAVNDVLVAAILFVLSFVGPARRMAVQPKATG
jgi:hypothetical protein